MARAIWKGTISFGLVNIPVSLTGAEAKPEVRLHMVDSKNHARIRYQKVNAETGEEVPWDRMVKAYEHTDGQFILLSEDELDAVQPKLTKAIEISEFVNLEEIDPLLFERPYYLEPDKRGRKAYALLREALRKSGKAGIARVVIQTREYLSALFVRNEVLVLMLLRFPQEIVAPSKLDLPTTSDKDCQPTQREMELATRLIDEMAAPWQPDVFRNEYLEALVNFIDKKVAGGETVRDVKEAESGTATDKGKVLDLAEYLERSIAQADRASPPPTKPRAPSKQPTTPHAAAKTAKKKGRRSA